jgi:hypothetical membrane protein
MAMNTLYSLWRFTGIAAAIIAWIVIAISISRNPWFDIYRHALSDLGDAKANKPWIYNIGLIIVGGIVCIYSLYLTFTTNSKAYVYTSALLFIAGLFLALIGIYPSGTRPHIFVSTWFFIQMWLAVIATAIGMAIERRVFYGAILAIVAVIGPIGAIFIKWPSVALQEVFGVILIDLYVVILTLNF